MRDLVELASHIDPTLSEHDRRVELCDLLLEELKTIKGRGLEPYLSDFAFDLVSPGTRIELKFPIGAHIPIDHGQDKANCEVLQELCKPVSKYLQDNFHPHTSIVITDSGISLNETMAFVPVKNESPSNPEQAFAMAADVIKESIKY